MPCLFYRKYWHWYISNKKKNQRKLWFPKAFLQFLDSFRKKKKQNKTKAYFVNHEKANLSKGGNILTWAIFYFHFSASGNDKKHTLLPVKQGFETSSLEKVSRLHSISDLLWGWLTWGNALPEER